MRLDRAQWNEMASGGCPHQWGGSATSTRMYALHHASPVSIACAHDGVYAGKGGCAPCTEAALCRAQVKSDLGVVKLV